LPVLDRRSALRELQRQSLSNLHVTVANRILHFQWSPFATAALRRRSNLMPITIPNYNSLDTMPLLRRDPIQVSYGMFDTLHRSNRVPSIQIG
jgi:hypothetical protein